MPHITLRYERDKLYEEIWAEPVTKVAVRYGISDVALRKICKQLGVPLPPVGYWAKLAAGKQPRIPPLPKSAGPSEIVRQRYVSDEPAEADPDHLVARREFEARPENRIAVAETVHAFHPLVTTTERALTGRKARAPTDLITAAKRCLDVVVSEASLPRALRIMDALVKALDARGMPIQIVEIEGKRQSCITLQGEQLAIRLAEGTVRTEREMTAKEIQYKKQYGDVYLPERYFHRATGLLKLGVVASYGDLRNVVADGKHRRIEHCLNEFIVKLETEAVRRKRHAEYLERQHRAWEEQARRHAEHEARREKEIERLKALQADARNWKRAEDIRCYIAAAELKAIQERGAIDADSELGLWIAWARHKADWIDPLIQAPCEVLGGRSNPNTWDAIC